MNAPLRSSATFTLILAFVFVVFSTPAWTKNFMSWNADSGTVDLADNGTGTCSFGSAAIVTNEKHEGTGSMRIQYGGMQGDVGCRSVFPQRNYGHKCTNGTKIFYRWWMKIDPNFNWGSYVQLIKSWRMKQSTEQNPLYFTGFFEHDGIFPTKASISGGPKLAWDFDPPCSNGGLDCTQWHEYIVEYKWQTGFSISDGEARLYVDGKLKAELTKQNWLPDSHFATADYTGTCTEGFSNGFMVQSFPQLCPNGQSCPGVGGYVWVDDFSVDDSWNSNAGPQPLPPTLLPVQ